jgi:predicted nucleotidyltransferase
MLQALIPSKMRLKLLLKFFLNSHTESYLRNLETEFGDSTNSIRLELNHMEKAGLLTSHSEGNKKLFRANTSHPLFPEINSILLKYIGLDQIIDKVIKNLGNVQSVYLTGSFARGIDSPIIDLMFTGEDINKEYLLELVVKAEKLIQRKIRFVVFSKDEIVTFFAIHTKEKALLLWEA